MIKSLVVFQVHIFMIPDHVPLDHVREIMGGTNQGSFSLILSLFLLSSCSLWPS